MQILVLIGTVGASPQTGEILPRCDFFSTVLSCHVMSFFLDPTPRSKCSNNFMLYGSNDVFPCKGPFGGSGR